MKKRAPLKKKTSLKKTGGVKRKKRRDPNSIPALRDKADKAFSRYVRLRDSERVGKSKHKRSGECITCDRKVLVIDKDGKWQKTAQNGHFIGRDNKELRYEETNCNLQCAHCNAWRDKHDMIHAYESAIIDKYGRDTLDELKERSKIKRGLTKAELKQIIEDSNEQIDFYLTQQ